MAYCSKCGAYIPDGQTKCLACGYDGAAPKASQYAYAYNEQSAKRDYEEERRKNQEQNRQWAKEEYARRKQEREQAQREAEEKAKRQAAERSYDENKRSSSGFTYTEGNSKVFASLSYISLGFMLQKMFLPDDEFAKYHAKQGERLFVCGIAAQIVGSIFGLGWIPFLLRIGYSLRGIANARDGQETELPYINDIFDKKK